LKIVRSELRVTLLESRQRRASFLSTVSRELGFEDVRVVCARAEDATQELGGSFDAVVARCAGHPDQVIALGERFVRPGGVVVVSGPPRPTSLRLGEWITTEGIEPGTKRRFAVHTAAA
jgi:16S rRNA (guanine527-N7)-methyltransferase